MLFTAVAIVAILAVVTFVLAYILWVKARRREIELQLHDGATIEELMPAMAALTWGRLIDGNRVEIIQNSGFFDALIEDFAAARHHIHLETFLWRDSEVSDRVTAALVARAEEGIEVRVLVDQRGAKQTNPMVWARLRRAGCDFRVYHRARFREFAWYNHRDHRKIAVIDGRIAYTFGHGVADMWGGTPNEPAGWRDTAARIIGPAVAEMQTAFFDNWVRTTAIAPTSHAYFPPLARAGDTALHVAYLRPREAVSAVQRLYFLAIAAARQEIVIQNPYFIPDSEALALFAAARRRGVHVAIMLPTSDTSDFAIVQHASHRYYGPLLRMGVRVFEFTRCGLHQKVMIVDGVWCSIGSTNFDPRSFRINDEITVAMCDRDVAAELRRAFEDDLRYADEWTLERWNSRTLKHKAIDRSSTWFKRQL